MTLPADLWTPERTADYLGVSERALGHSNIKTTMRYVHASDDDVRAGLDASENVTNEVVKRPPSRFQRGEGHHTDERSVEYGYGGN